jgi:hypothetical protein
MPRCSMQPRLAVRVARLWVALGATFGLVACGTDLSLGEMLRHQDDASGGSTGDPDSSIVGNGGSGGSSDPGSGGSSALGGGGPDSSGADAVVRVDANSAGGGNVGDGATGTDARADGADVSVCRAVRAVCTRPEECCSSFCIGQVCTEPGICQTPGTTCTQSGTCCSGRCDPPAAGTNLVCRDYCSADGARCTRPQDCCSLGCVNSTCSATICRSQGLACSANADCCSNNCDLVSGLCLFVGNNHDLCQFPGEQCVNTDEAVTCCSGSCNATTLRCNLPQTTCRGVGSTCTLNADCCKGVCRLNAQNQRVCQIPCATDGGTCAGNAECCSFRCSGSPATCAPPQSLDGGPVCQSTGLACTANAQCCSRFCAAGFCDLPCQLTGVACRVGTDCCSGICTGSVCQPLP